MAEVRPESGRGDVRRGGFGFTLIEVLVVIALVSLLISIIMPALGRARETGRRTVCGNNLREFAQALWHYAEDNEGWYPAKWVFGKKYEPVCELAKQQCAGSSQGKWGLQFAGMLRDIMERDFTQGAVESPKYIPDPRVLVCPSDLQSNGLAGCDAKVPAPQVPVRVARSVLDINTVAVSSSPKPTDCKNYSYMYIALWRNDDRPDFFLMADESNQPDNAMQSLTGLTPDDNHGIRGINALFCDTHVEWQQSRGGDFGSLQELAGRLWNPIISVRPRWPDTQTECPPPPGGVPSRSQEVQTID